jgi:23S rRNA pseudouridine955/2504/2580 synthase
MEQQGRIISHGVRKVTVGEDRQGQRLDNFLLGELKGLPRSRLYRLLRKGEVRVNGSRVKPELRLKSGDIIRIPPVRLGEKAPAPQAGTRLLAQLGEAILYEDNDLIVINKPTGLAVHGGSGIKLGLIESMRQLRPDAKALELVHRLDRDTSGCIMLAKRRSALHWFHAALSSGGVEKRYLALADGAWPAHCDEVNAPLRKNQLRSGERMVSVSADGKACLTRFKIKQSNATASLIEAEPVTGRTHQIRVHALHAGHPLVGDSKYGLEDINRRFKAMGCDRLFLHAASLRLKLPAGRLLEVQAPLPLNLEKTLKKVFK